MGLSARAEGDSPMFAAKRVFLGTEALPAANIGTVPREWLRFSHSPPASCPWENGMETSRPVPKPTFTGTGPVGKFPGRFPPRSEMARLVRIGASFLIVLAAYWAYSLLAVPLIEPPAAGSRSDGPTEAERQMAAQRLVEQAGELDGLFPAGSWELDNPKILESDQIKLLLRDYANLSDGGVEIRPCTVIFTPKDSVDPAERKRRSVILQAPEGARLEFDEPFDLRRGRIGRLTSGHLDGQITIRSAGRSPGAEDDLLVITRNVDLNAERIWTPQAVEFRYGPNYGRGEQLHVKLLPAEPSDPSSRGLTIGGVEMFEIARLETLHLVPGTVKMSGDGAPGQAGEPAWASQSPIEVRCQGPFRFDPVRQVATFENNVGVFLVNPNGPSDQLSCELLSIYFARPRPDAPPPAGSPDTRKSTLSNPLDLRPRRLEAQGRPVVALSRSRDAHARGERLEYDLQTQQISLQGSPGQEAFLRQGPNEIHAQRLEYQFAGPGRMGKLRAQGPGQLKGQPAPNAAGPLLARWNDSLRLRPDQDQQVISLSGNAELNYAGIGQLTAPEIHFWFDELPAEVARRTGQPAVRPARMLAVPEVRLASPQMSGTIQRLEAWFEQAPPPSDPPPVPAAAPVGPPVAGPSPAFPSAGQAVQAITQPRHFELTGHRVRARIALRAAASELVELMIDGNVQLLETRTALPSERPLVLRGDQVHVLHAASPNAELVVIGQPAHFEARGLGLTGGNINLNSGTNRLWIDGGGRMDLPLQRDLEGRPLAEPMALDIFWQRKMEFDGATVSFYDSVVAQSKNQKLATETLEIRLKNPIRFAAAGDPSSGQPEIDQIACRGGLRMENHALEGTEQASSDRLETADLTINLASGDALARGPGRMTTVRRGSLKPIGAVGSPPLVNQLATPGQGELAYLNVRFQDKLTGNFRLRTVTFHEQIKAVYGAVHAWDEVLDPEKPELFGPSGLLLNCHQLTVSQPAVAQEDRGAIELEAHGNVVVEGSSYFARAAAMKYSQAKNWLILEGDGRADAEFYQQKSVGGPAPKATAHRFLYWPSTRRLEVEGARSIELNQLPGR